MTVEATDPDNNPITLTAYGLPPGASFDPADGHFTWEPGYEDAGKYDLAFVASDGQLSVSREVTLEVHDRNRAPVFELVGPQNLSERESLTFTVATSDPEGEPVTLDVDDSSLPAGATFDATTGIFNWVPGSDQAGEYSVLFLASDGIVPSSLEIPITVENAPLVETVGDEFDINETSSSIISQPEVAIREDGSFMAVWLSRTSVIARAFDPEGAPLSAEITVNSTTTGRFEKPLVSVHRSGSYVISWVLDQGSGNKDIYLRRFDENGNPISDAVLLKSARGSCVDYSLAAANRDTNYDFVFAYSESACVWPETMKVSFPVFSDEEENGVWFGDEVTYGNDDNLSYSGNPHITMGSDGGDFYGRTYISYSHMDAGTAPCIDVRTTTVNQWTTPLDDYARVRPPPSYPGDFCPRSMMDLSPVASSDSSNYGTIVDPYGFVWLRRSSTTGTDASFYYDMEGNADGYLWSGGLLIAGINDSSLVEARYFDDDGNRIEDPVVLSSVEGENPKMDGNRARRVVTLWQEGDNLKGRLLQLIGGSE